MHSVHGDGLYVLRGQGGNPANLSQEVDVKYSGLVGLHLE